MEGQGPTPGWYQDPEGSGQRYWDGVDWTEHRSGVQQVPPPVQPSSRYPLGAPPGKQKGSGGTVWKVMLGVVLGGLVLIVGCVAVLGSAVNEADKEQREQGITIEQFRSVGAGTSQEEVEATLGPPEDAQEFEQNIPELDIQNERSSCIYYPEKGKGIGEGRSFQFCFDNGRLRGKNAY